MELELNLEICRAVLESVPIGVYLTDRKRQIVFWNTRAERITGYLGQEVVGHYCPDNLLMHCDENQVSLCSGECPLARTMQDGRIGEATIFLRHKEGQRVPVRVQAVPLRDESGAIVGAAEFFEEQSFRATGMRCPHLREKVSLDDITEVPDRGTTESAIAAALETFAASAAAFGVITIAIDNLDHLRRVYGCQASNAILYAAAQTLSAGTRPEDLVGRWNEDRFVALVACPGTEGLRSCAERLRRLIGVASVPWWGDRLSFTVSMGGTMVRPADTVQSLLARGAEALAAGQAARGESITMVLG
jgi:diguanylate cyclase (GGDEF)-like protein/PAS domain S-box-containing protein